MDYVMRDCVHGLGFGLGFMRERGREGEGGETWEGSGFDWVVDWIMDNG